MNDLKKQLAKIKQFIGEQSPENIVFHIGGEDDENDYVEVDGNKMTYEEFNDRFPQYKPSDTDFIIGEWHE